MVDKNIITPAIWHGKLTPSFLSKSLPLDQFSQLFPPPSARRPSRSYHPKHRRRWQLDARCGLKSYLSAWKPFGLMNESDLSDFHELRRGFIPCPSDFKISSAWSILTKDLPCLREELSFRLLLHNFLKLGRCIKNMHGTIRYSDACE